jgi:hypothetical protein
MGQEVKAQSAVTDFDRVALITALHCYIALSYWASKLLSDSSINMATFSYDALYNLLVSHITIAGKLAIAVILAIVDADLEVKQRNAKFTVAVALKLRLNLGFSRQFFPMQKQQYEVM